MDNTYTYTHLHIGKTHFVRPDALQLDYISVLLLYSHMRLRFMVNSGPVTVLEFVCAL